MNPINSRVTCQTLLKRIIKFNNKQKRRIHGPSSLLLISITMIGVASSHSDNSYYQVNQSKSQPGNQFSLNRSVIVSGNPANVIQYKLKSGIGQSVVGTSIAGPYQFNAGFFHANRDLIFSNEFETNN